MLPLIVSVIKYSLIRPMKPVSGRICIDVKLNRSISGDKNITMWSYKYDDTY